AMWRQAATGGATLILARQHPVVALFQSFLNQPVTALSGFAIGRTRGRAAAVAAVAAVSAYGLVAAFVAAFGSIAGFISIAHPIATGGQGAIVTAMVGLGVAVASCIVARFVRVEHAISARCSLAADTASTGLGVAIGGPVVAFFTIVNMPVATERRAAICGAATVCQLCAIAISPITRFADVTHAIAACGQKAIRTTDIRCRIAVCSGLVAAARAGSIDRTVPVTCCS